MNINENWAGMSCSPSSLLRLEKSEPRYGVVDRFCFPVPRRSHVTSSTTASSCDQGRGLSGIFETRTKYVSFFTLFQCIICQHGPRLRHALYCVVMLPGLLLHSSAGAIARCLSQRAHSARLVRRRWCGSHWSDGRRVSEYVLPCRCSLLQLAWYAVRRTPYMYSSTLGEQ